MKLILFVFLSLMAQSSFAEWTLVNHASNVNFFSSNKYETEVNSFSNMMGQITKLGNLKATIDLSSIDTKNSKKDLLIQDLLFETRRFNEASMSIDLGERFLNKLDLDLKNTIKTPVEVVFIFHGVVQKVTMKITITRLNNNFLVVKSYEPVILSLTDFNMDKGIALLSKKGFFSIYDFGDTSFI